ncbi:MAG: gfo/Idh/MocA family oxidoreductase [Candidatus Latescibacteria bacterium]|nr:gfo/Idh/MocA family oxidoreductase [Candidatus Latescibacterota bacterium]
MPVKIGFVGSGGIANHHMRTLAQIEAAQMTAFCDVVEEKAQAAAQTYGGKAYTDYTAMYDSEDLDAVYICVPPFAHDTQELAALARGLPIFVEKPVALTLAKAEEILAAVEAKSVVTAVGYHWRYTQASDRARQLIGDRPIGFALGSWMGGMPVVPWWRVMDQSGGQMVEQTTHIFDTARYFLGPVTQVHCSARTGLMGDVEQYDIHDASITNLTFASGAIASITSACIIQSGGHVGLDLYLKDQVLRLNRTELIVDDSQGSQTFAPGDNPTLREDTAFVEAVASGDGSAIRSDYADAVATLKVSLAANQSIIEGRPINL